MKIEIRKNAIKDLKNISEPFRSKIHLAISKLKNFPNLHNIKKLTDFEPAYRLRIGKYRELFDVEKETIFVGRILHRKDSYKK